MVLVQPILSTDRESTKILHLLTGGRGGQNGQKNADVINERLLIENSIIIFLETTPNGHTGCMDQ